MPIGQPTPTASVYSAKIITSDPSTHTIEAMLPDYLASVNVVTTAVAFRWPVAGETWRIKNMNGVWYLDEPYPKLNPGTSDPTSTTASTTINTIAPGDAVINSPTGVIHVLGSTDGSTDFTVSSTPSGVVQQFAGTTPPKGYVMCDGTTYNSTDANYASLYKVIGNTYNTGGEAAGFFRVPNTKGATPIGAGTGTSGTTYALAARGGEEKHTLIESEMPSHAHGGQTGSGSTSGSSASGTTNTDYPDHTHNYLEVTGGNGLAAGSNYGTAYGATLGANQRHQHDFSVNVPGQTVNPLSIASDGSNVPHNIVQPFIVFNYIIKL